MFERYSNPDAVGWLGYFSEAGEVEAFVGLDKRVLFVSEIEGWDGDSDVNEPPDPADWWKDDEDDLHQAENEPPLA